VTEETERLIRLHQGVVFVIIRQSFLKVRPYKNNNNKILLDALFYLRNPPYDL
jgi:hypothetical protein